jgi:hypothetical protein
MKKRYHIPLWLLLGLAAVLVVARLMLPHVVRDTLNDRLAHMGDYRGHVADVDIHLWRGAYSLEQLRVEKVSGKVPVPLLAMPRMDIALSWRALWHGAIRATVDFRRPVLNFVDGSGDADSQAGRGVDWRAQLQQLMPMRLDEVNVHDGTVTFRNFVSSPRVDLKATDVQGTVTNLTNADRAGGRRVASLHATASILGEAPLETTAHFDPLERDGDFSFELRVLRVQLVDANDLARAYAGLDFASGHGDFVMEIDARDGQLTGYAKPLFKDMKIFSWKQDVEQDHKNPLSVAWEALAQGVTWIFKNHAEDQFATRVPISGRIDEKRLGVAPAVFNVLRNAFVKAYTPQLEHLRPAPDDDSP